MYSYSSTIRVPVPFFEYSHSYLYLKPLVLGKYSYSLGCALGTLIKKQSSTRVLSQMAKEVVDQHQNVIKFCSASCMSKCVTKSVRSSFIVQEQAFNFLCCRTSANCYWSHTVTHCQMRVHVERFRNIFKHSTWRFWISRLSLNISDCHICLR